MTDPTKARDSLLDKANAAFEQAAAKVIERARQTGTPVLVWQDDHIKEVTPEQLIENRELKTENND